MARDCDSLFNIFFLNTCLWIAWAGFSWNKLETCHNPQVWGIFKYSKII